MGLFDKAKEFVTDPANVAKAKEQMTDEHVGAATDKLKQFAPDQADGAIDSVGERAKEWGGPEEPAQEQQQEREGGRDNDGPGRHGGGDDDGPGRRGGGVRD
jgi:hypothetical protein